MVSRVTSYLRQYADHNPTANQWLFYPSGGLRRQNHRLGRPHPQPICTPDKPFPNGKEAKADMVSTLKSRQGCSRECHSHLQWIYPNLPENHIDNIT